MNSNGTETTARVAVMAVCLDPGSYQALSHFMAGIPGAVTVGNLEQYSGAEREAAHALEKGRLAICLIDYDRNTDEAIWVTERLRSESPGAHIFAVSAYSEPERIISAMR